MEQGETLSDVVSLAFYGRFGQAALLLLMLMSVGATAISFDRFRRYRKQRKASLNFGERVGETLHGHEPDALIVIALSNNSPAATVIAAGLIAFLKVPDRSGVEAARRTAALSTRAVRFSLQRGLNHLGAIVVTAPFVGVLATCYGMLFGFGGCGSSKEACVASLFYTYSRALISTVVSLVVAVPSSWALRYFESRLNTFDLEMEGAGIELVNYLTVYLQQRRAG